jgi:hypothetical protein
MAATVATAVTTLSGMADITGCTVRIIVAGGTTVDGGIPRL